MFGFPFTSPNSFSIGFNINENISKEEPREINLFDLKFDPFNFLSKSFKITTSKRSYSFNTNLIKKSSSVLSSLIDSDSNYSEFKINVSDDYNTMEKIENLYSGKKVIIFKYEYSFLQKFVNILKINNFPSFDNENEKFVLSISNYSFISFFRCNYLLYKISTKKNNYSCSNIGIKSSGACNYSFSSSYTYDFPDENNEFSIICDFFSFKSIKITTQNVAILKKISEDLKINCLLEKINEFNNYYEFSVQCLNNKKDRIESVEELFQCLFNRQHSSAESIKDKLIDSIWSHSEDNVKEMVACIIHVINIDTRLHPFLMNLIELLDQSKSDDNNLKVLIPFLIQKLMNEIGSTLPNCAFIYRLSQKGFISSEEIAEVIYRRLSFEDESLQKGKDMEPFNFVNRYLIKIEQKLDSISRNNALIWFWPELMEIKHLKPSFFHSKLSYSGENLFDKYFPSNTDKFKAMRESGEPDDQITSAIRRDDVDELKSNTPSGHFMIFNNVPYNIFESFVENGSTSLLNYAAAYGSIKCFKYLLDKKVSIADKTFTYAVFGENNEIMECVNQSFESQSLPWGSSASNKNISLKNLKANIDNNFFQPALPKLSIDPKEKFNHYTFSRKESNTWGSNGLHPIVPAIRRHNNNLFNCILANTCSSPNFDDTKLFLFLFEECNISLIDFMIKSGLYMNILTNKEIMDIIKISTKSGFYTLTELIFSLIFNDYKRILVNNPLEVINFEDSVSFGNLSIFKLYASLNINDIYFKDIFAISLIHEDTSIIEYSLMYPFIQHYHFLNEDVRDLIKLSIYKKGTDIFEFLMQRLGNQIIIDDCPKKSDDSFLSFACAFNNIKACKKITDLIIEKKLKIDFTLPFIYAARQESVEICKYLIDKKVFINFRMIVNKKSDLSTINKSIFEMLYNIADEEIKDVFLESYLYETMKNKNKDVVEFILQNNVPYDNLLFEAVKLNDIEMVELVLTHDESPYFINKMSSKGTALYMAVKNKNIDIVKRLLSISGINPSLRANDETPLIAAFSLFNMEMINLFYDFYAENIQSQLWQFNGALKLVLELLSRNFSDYKSSAPDVIQKLYNIENIDYNCSGNNYTLLTYACEAGQKELAEKLLKCENVNINTFSSDSGNTPLMVSIEKGNLEITKLLIQSSKVEINARNYLNQTALTIASEKNFTDIVELIVNNKSFDPKESNLDYAFYLSGKTTSSILYSLKDLNVNFMISNENNVENKNNTFNIPKPPSFSFPATAPKTIIGFSFGSFGTSSTNGFGTTTTTGFGTSPTTGFGTTTTTGFGTSSTTGFGTSSTTGFGTSSTTGFGTSSTTGFGTTTTTGFGTTTTGFKKDSSITNIKPFKSTIPCYILETTLIRAVKNNDSEKVSKIIKHQSFDQNKSQIIAAIFTAASMNNVNILNILLPVINNDVNIHLHNESLLVVSSKYNNKEVIQAIFDNQNFDPDKSEINVAFGQLLSNSEFVSTNLLDLLIEHDSKHQINFSKPLPNGKSYFTTLSPSAKNLKEVVDYLLKHGADPNSEDKFGEYPLQYAINSLSLEFVKTLIDTKKINLLMRIHISEEINGYTTTDVSSTYLHLAAKLKDSKIFDKIFDLKLININSLDSQGETPLMVCVRYKNTDIIRKLFKEDDLNYEHRNKNKENVLDINKSSYYFISNLTKEDYLKKLTQ